MKNVQSARSIPVCAISVRNYANKELEEKRKEKKAKEAAKKQLAQQAVEKDAKRAQKNITQAKSLQAAKPRIPKPKNKMLVPLKDMGPALDTEATSVISDFLTSHQTVDFSATLGFLGYENEVKSGENLDEIVKGAVQSIEQILNGEVENNLKSVSAANLASALEKVETIKERVLLLCKTLQEVHTVSDIQYEAGKVAKRFATTVNKRYVENPLIFARVNGNFVFFVRTDWQLLTF